VDQSPEVGASVIHSSRWTGAGFDDKAEGCNVEEWEVELSVAEGRAGPKSSESEEEEESSCDAGWGGELGRSSSGAGGGAGPMILLRFEDESGELLWRFRGPVSESLLSSLGFRLRFSSMDGGSCGPTDGIVTGQLRLLSSSQSSKLRYRPTGHVRQASHVDRLEMAPRGPSRI